MLLFEKDNKIKQLKLHILRVRGKCPWERKHTHYLMAFILKPICRVCACLKYTVSMNRKGASFCLQSSANQFTILLKLFYFSKIYILILLHGRMIFILICQQLHRLFFLACWIQRTTLVKLLIKKRIQISISILQKRYFLQGLVQYHLLYTV